MDYTGVMQELHTWIPSWFAVLSGTAQAQNQALSIEELAYRRADTQDSSWHGALEQLLWRVPLRTLAGKKLSHGFSAKHSRSYSQMVEER